MNTNWKQTRRPQQSVRLHRADGDRRGHRVCNDHHFKHGSHRYGAVVDL